MFLQDYIGNTPLVTLQRLNAGVGNRISVKLEGNNPAGSVKDRPAYSMIKHAEARGEIKPGDNLVEATSGNTGIALAMVAATSGYRMTLIMLYAGRSLTDPAGLLPSSFTDILLPTPALRRCNVTRGVFPI